MQYEFLNQILNVFFLNAKCLHLIILSIINSLKLLIVNKIIE